MLGYDRLSLWDKEPISLFSVKNLPGIRGPGCKSGSATPQHHQGQTPLSPQARTPGEDTRATSELQLRYNRLKQPQPSKTDHQFPVGMKPAGRRERCCGIQQTCTL